MKRKALTHSDLQAVRDKDRLVEPTPEQQAKGYAARFVTHVESGTKAKAHKNPDVDVVERWEREDRLTPDQFAAIEYVRRLWRQTEMKQRLTASLEPAIAGYSNEWAAIHEIDARRELHRLQDRVARHYWDCFENVCRHNMAAGVAGADLFPGSARNNSDRAFVVVCFVADIVAMEVRS